MESLKKPCWYCGAPRYVKGRALCAVCHEERSGATDRSSAAHVAAQALTLQNLRLQGTGPSNCGGDTHAAGGCATCRHFDHWSSTVMTSGVKFLAVGGNAWCRLDNCRKAQPRHGCHDWEREVGADDEPFNYG